MRHIQTFLLTVIFFLVIVPGTMRAQTITYEEYWVLIEETRQIVTAGNIDAIRQQANILEDIDAVTLTSGATIPISHEYLVSRMREEPLPIEHLNDTFNLMLAEHDLPEAEDSEATVEEATTKRNQVLSRPEFQYEEGPISQWLNELFDMLTNLLGRVSVPIGGSARLLISLVGFLVVLAGLGFALKNILERAVSEGRYNPNLDEMEILTSQTALERAKETSSEGDYRSAVRYLYLSTLLTLEERNLLRYDRTWTNLEYIRSLRDRPEIAATLSDIVDVFDRVWYGFQTIDAITYERYAQRVAELQRQR